METNEKEMKINDPLIRTQSVSFKLIHYIRLSDEAANTCDGHRKQATAIADRSHKQCDR